MKRGADVRAMFKAAKEKGGGGAGSGGHQQMGSLANLGSIG